MLIELLKNRTEIEKIKNFINKNSTEIESSKSFSLKKLNPEKFLNFFPLKKKYISVVKIFILLSNSYNWTYSNWFAALDLPLHSVLLPCNNINAVTSVWPAFSWIQLPVPPQLRHTGLCGVPHIMTGKAVKQFHQPSAKLPPSSPSSAHAPRAPFRFVVWRVWNMR